MDHSLFQALDQMVEHGGRKLAKGVVVGKLAKKAADALLAELEAQNYIRKDSGKFTITDEGRHAWERKASEGRKQELADRPVAEFLAVVAKQDGKALTKTQQQKFDADFIKRVLVHDLIIEAATNKYKLSTKGKEFLEAYAIAEQARAEARAVAEQARVIEEQLKPLRSAAQDLLKEPQALLRRITSDFEQLAEGGPIRSAFEEARKATEDDMERAHNQWQRSLDGLQGFASLVAAVERFRKALPATESAAVRRIATEVERVEKLDAELRRTVKQLQEQLVHAQQHMEGKVVALAEKLRADRQPTGPTKPTLAPDRAVAAAPPSDEVVWQATQRAYQQLEQQFKLTSELIKVPNLTDHVRAEVPGLTAAHFHDLLQRWQREDRLVLQVCNDPHREPRSKEGITSSRGLLFYVELK